METWATGAVTVVQDTITRALEAPREWEGHRIVVVTDGNIMYASSSSIAEMNFRVLVPRSTNLSVHERRLTATELDNKTYQERVSSWQEVLAGLQGSSEFMKEMKTGLTSSGLPTPPGMFFGSNILRLERYNSTNSFLVPSFVVRERSAAAAEPPATAGSVPSGRVASFLLPVAFLVLCLNVCIVARWKCGRKRLEDIFGLLQDQALKTGASIESALKDIPFTPSPSNKRASRLGHGNDTGPRSSQQFDMCRSAGSGGQNDSGSAMRLQSGCGTESGGQRHNNNLVAEPESCTPAMKSHISDDVDICSVTSSPCRSPTRRRITDLCRLATPEVKTPFQRDSDGFESVALKTTGSFNVEDLSPAPAGAGSNGRHSLNSIFTVQPPQPPRHKFRPSPVGPPLRESLEDSQFEEPQQPEPGPRFADWVSFSPLRRKLRGKPSDPWEEMAPISPSRPVKCVVSLTPEMGRDAVEHALGLPNIVLSPARRRKGFRPSELDVGFLQEAGDGPPAFSPETQPRSDRSTASTPQQPDTCLDVTSPAPRAEPDCGEWTPTKSESSPSYAWRPTFSAAFARPKTGASFGARAAELDCGLPGGVCSPSRPRRIIHKDFA